MPHQHDIRNLIQIQDENISFQEPMTEERKVKGQAALILHASLTYTPHCCAKCGVVNQNYTIIKNGTQESMITLPFHPLQTLLFMSP